MKVGESDRKGERGKMIGHYNGLCRSFRRSDTTVITAVTGTSGKKA